MEFKIDPAFPEIKTPEQARRMEQALTAYENEKSLVFQRAVTFIKDHGHEIEAYADRTEHMGDLAEDLADLKRAINAASDAQETFMRAVIGR